MLQWQQQTWQSSSRCAKGRLPASHHKASYPTWTVCKSSAFSLVERYSSRPWPLLCSSSLNSCFVAVGATWEGPGAGAAVPGLALLGVPPSVLLQHDHSLSPLSIVNRPKASHRARVNTAARFLACRKNPPQPTCAFLFRPNRALLASSSNQPA